MRITRYQDHIKDQHLMESNVAKLKMFQFITIIGDVNANVYILSISFQSMYTLRTVCHQHVN